MDDAFFDLGENATDDQGDWLDDEVLMDEIEPFGQPDDFHAELPLSKLDRTSQKR